MAVCFFAKQRSSGRKVDANQPSDRCFLSVQLCRPSSESLFEGVTDRAISSEPVTYACSGPALSTDMEAMRWCVEGRRAEMVVTMMRYVQAISRNSVEVTVPLALTRMAACCCCRIMHDQSTDFSHSGTAELFSIVNLRDSRFTIADCIHES